MELKQICTIYKKGNYSQNSNNYLHLLYAPLIQQDACMLYELFLSLDTENLSVEKILEFYGWHKNRFEAAKKTLEQFHLMRTYFDGVHQKYILEVLPPLSSQEFLNHDTFSRLLLNQCGSSHFDWLQRHFNDNLDLEGYVDMSEEMDLSILENWTEEKESMFLNLKPQESSLDTKFDFKTFLKGTERFFPMRYRTKENLNRIASLATLYGVSAQNMRKYVQRAFNPNTKVFDFNKLKQMVYATKSIENTVADPYELAPIAFLKYKQKGAPVAKSDTYLIENIIEKYHFTNEVTNVLIEYCLNQNNQKLTKNYVEKVAASWIRLNVDTKEKALQATRNTTSLSQQASSLPKWYNNTQQTKPDEDLLKQALELQKQLKGEQD